MTKKITVEYDLDTPEGEDRFRKDLNGMSYAIVLFSLDQYCRNKIKYASSVTPEAEIKAYEDIRSQLRDLADEYLIDSWEPL